MPVQPREGYRFLEHVTDAFIEAWGDSFESALVQAGVAFFDTITDTSKIRSTDSERIEAGGHDELELVYNWLEALLLKFEINGLLFSKFHIEQVTRQKNSFQIDSSAEGEAFDPTRHSKKVEVKGITYHLMAVEKDAARTTIRFILDL